MRYFAILTGLSVFVAGLCCQQSASAESGVPDAQRKSASSDSGDSVSEGRREFARKRFLEGVQAYEEGRYKDSIDLLLEADQAMHSPAFAFNVGLAYQAMGDASNALRWLRAYLRELPEAEDREQVEEMIAALEEKLRSRGVQQVTVLSEPGGATLLIDGNPVGVTPWTGELPPGQHHAALQLRGHTDTDTTFELDAAAARDVSLTLEQQTVPTGPPAGGSAVGPKDETPTAADDGGGIGPWTWLTLGAGAAALGGALTFELLRQSAESDAESAAQVDYLDALDRAQERQLTARILAGVGGALVLTGAVLLTVDVTSTGSNVQTALGCTPTGCTVTARGAL